MKNSTAVVVLIVAILIALGAWMYRDKMNTTDDTTKESSLTGTLYVGVTDATEDIKNVNDIDLSVKKVELYSQTDGWVTVSNDSKTYPLLELKANSDTKLYASKTSMKAGAYDKVRVTLGDVNVRTKTNGTVKAAVPSSQIVINTKVRINNNQKSHIVLDFLADKSLHATASNKYVFAPVVETKAQSNSNVSINNTNSMTATGGTLDSSSQVGMDLNGTSRLNFQLSTDNTLEVKSVSGNKFIFMLKGKEINSDSSTTQESQMETTTDNNGFININGNLKLDANSNTGMNGNNTNTNTNTSGSGVLDVKVY